MSAMSFKTKSAALQYAESLGLPESAVVKASAKKWTVEAAPASYVDHAIPHDLADGEADQSCPVAIDEMSDEEFARIMINGGKSAPAQKRTGAARAKSEGAPWGYRGAPKNPNSTMAIVWAVLDTMEAGQVAITPDAARQIATEIGKSLSTVNDCIRFWRYHKEVEGGGAPAAPVITDDLPAVTSIDEVEVTEV